MFTFLIGFVAFVVASCAAFFSVQGLATLYSGQFISVCIMAGSLEMGKLIAASYLHRYWNKAASLLRIYLVSAVVVLMGITSLGIFGFLSSAYHKSYSKVELVDAFLEGLNSKKTFLELEISSSNERIATLNSARVSQEKRLPGLSSKAAKPIYEDIERSGKEISEVREKINQLSENLLAANEEILEYKGKKNASGDIGTLQFVADSFGVTIDEVVKWFTLAIVGVFDPLAVCLVLAYNGIISSKTIKQDESELEEIQEEEEEVIISKTIKKTNTGQNESKYRDQS
jgi:hypothetical protein